MKLVMDYNIFKFLLPLLFLMLNIAQAAPFRSQYVCIPREVFSNALKDFKIRDGGQCSDHEQWTQVIRQADGSLLLLPAEPPLQPKSKKELKQFKKYYGVER